MATRGDQEFLFTRRGSAHLSRRQALTVMGLAGVATWGGGVAASAAAITWGHPLATRTKPSYGFGPRSGGFHYGIDYPRSGGTLIHSIADARVQNVAYHGGYGYFVELEHANGWSSVYGHMRRMSSLKIGARVLRGALVGEVGSTGNASGTHLHIEMRDRPGGTAFDPAPYVHNAPLPPEFPGEDDMPLSDEDVQRIADAVWSKVMHGGSKLPDGKTIPKETAAERLRQIRRSTANGHGRLLSVQSSVKVGQSEGAADGDLTTIVKSIAKKVGA